jgi:hypothetical protein
MACFHFDGAKIRKAVLTWRTPISRSGYNGHKKKSRRPSQASGLNKQNLVFTITALADGYCKK